MLNLSITRLFLFIILSMLTLGGCSFLSPVKPLQDTTYVLNTVNPDTLQTPKSNLTLLVTMPQAVPAFSSTRIAYVTQPYQLAYFSKNHWVDPPAEMLLPLMIQSLQNTEHFHAVVSPPFGSHADIVLNTQLLQLQQEFLQHPSQVRLVMRAQLINTTTQRIIATQQFTIIKVAPQDNPYGGVVAANCAVADFLQRLARFCLQVT